MTRRARNLTGSTPEEHEPPAGSRACFEHDVEGGLLAPPGLAASSGLLLEVLHRYVERATTGSRWPGPVTQAICAGRFSGCITGLGLGPPIAAQLRDLPAPKRARSGDFRRRGLAPSRTPTMQTVGACDAMRISTCGIFTGCAAAERRFRSGAGWMICLYTDVGASGGAGSINGLATPVVRAGSGRGAEIWILETATIRPGCAAAPSSFCRHALSYGVPLSDPAGCGTGRGCILGPEPGWALPSAVAGPYSWKRLGGVATGVGRRSPWQAAWIKHGRVGALRDRQRPLLGAVDLLKIHALILARYQRAARDYCRLRRSAPRSLVRPERRLEGPGTPCCSPGIQDRSRSFISVGADRDAYAAMAHSVGRKSRDRCAPSARPDVQGLSRCLAHVSAPRAARTRELVMCRSPPVMCCLTA